MPELRMNPMREKQRPGVRTGKNFYPARPPLLSPPGGEGEREKREKKKSFVRLS